MAGCLRWLALDQASFLHSTAVECGCSCNMAPVIVPTPPCCRQGRLWHAVACGCFATGHTSWCLRWLALGKASFLHSTAAACGWLCNMSHVIVPALACFRQGKLWHAVACGCFATGHTSWCLRWLAFGKVSFLQTKTVACRCMRSPLQPVTCHNAYAGFL